MGKAVYLGIEDAARKLKKTYLGLDDTAHKLKKVYLGVEDKARMVYTAGEVALEWGDISKSVNATTTSVYTLYTSVQITATVAPEGTKTTWTLTPSGVCSLTKNSANKYTIQYSHRKLNSSEDAKPTTPVRLTVRTAEGVEASVKIKLEYTSVTIGTFISNQKTYTGYGITGVTNA